MEKIILVDPYNKNHIELIKKFEKEYQTDSSASDSLMETSSSQRERDYQASKRQSNNIEEYFILEDNSKVQGLCHLYGEKDRKTCRIAFPTLLKKSKIKQTLILVTNYAMNNLGMMEVIIDVDRNAKDIESYLEKHNYENLGEESSKIIYLKEKETRKTGEENYHESIR